MKSIIFAAIAALIAIPASADISHIAEGNTDLYGSVLLDEPNNNPASIQPGFGDLYGSILFDVDKPVSGTGTVHKGTHDSYGSILFDVNPGLDW